MISLPWVITGGRAQLAARLDRPDSAPRAQALFAHCFTCSKDSLAASRITRGLVSHGIGVLRVDFTGLGESEGGTEESSFCGDVTDLVIAADRLREDGHAPEILVGHSLGGAAALAAAARIPEVRVVVTIGAPFSPAHVLELLGKNRSALERDGEATIDIGGRPIRLRREFLDELEQLSPDYLGQIDRPTLVLHATGDTIVPNTDALRIVEAIGPRAALIPLEGADHLLSRSSDADRVTQLIDTWASPYLPDTAPSDDERPEPGTVVVTEIEAAGYAQDISTARHRWRADEPTPVGSDSGPDPYQLLLSALGACTAMTIRMYANRKGIPLEHVKATLTHDRLHARDCEDCESRTGHVDRIVREISLEGPLDDAQRARLLAIADRCPVHRTLQSEVVIETDEV
ncbi:bifunctional alpha/beta hydrolase/OsmC family protein [Pseudonocardia spinosispora]|uniref:bifunctional alpha/beta hydrolase/OsmC family protein n=1 Tax=Pseudonocardia spinosispora TaxID=103441 RepID=UPI0005691B89|nr:alpha/beta fold hydrolase [Pseudonocardia spinosispora]